MRNSANPSRSSSNVSTQHNIIWIITFRLKRSVPANIAEVRQFGDALPEVRFEVAWRVLGAAATTADDWFFVVFEVEETVRGDLAGLLCPDMMIRRAGGSREVGDAGNQGQDSEGHFDPHVHRNEIFQAISFSLACLVSASSASVHVLVPCVSVESNHDSDLVIRIKSHFFRDWD